MGGTRHQSEGGVEVGEAERIGEVDWERWCSDSFTIISKGARQMRPRGRPRTGDQVVHLQFQGERPDDNWHAHGWFRRSLRVLRAGRVLLVVLWKRRWRLVGTNRTTHSRPPCEPPRLRFCSLIVVLMLWAWLGQGRGLEQQEPVLDTLNQLVDRSTQRRWLAKTLPCALAIQQAIRRALIEMSEPRPFERLFPSGLSPPSELQRRRWQDPSAVSSLWRGLAMAMYGAAALPIPVAALLAEARGRWEGPGDSVIP